MGKKITQEELDRFIEKILKFKPDKEKKKASKSDKESQDHDGGKNGSTQKNS